MPKRRPKKIVYKADVTERLCKALSQRTKRELIDALVELARDDRGVLRRLDARFAVGAALPELVGVTRQAIADATDFDEREINYNFDYDYAAYEEVKRNLGRLIDLGQPRLAMELSRELLLLRKVMSWSSTISAGKPGLPVVAPEALLTGQSIMDQASHQVAMSDEGLMTSDIEECLQVVVAALPKSDVPPEEIVAWCKAMTASDHVGCIYDREFRALQRQFETSGS